MQVCPDDALHMTVQTPESIKTLRKDWEFWLDLPNTSEAYIRIDDLEEAIGALETLLLDKTNYKSMVGGDGACLGCGEKTVMHLFTATVEALMRPRVAKHVSKIEELIQNLEKHIRLRLAESVDVGDTSAMVSAIDALKNKDLTLSNLSGALDNARVSVPLDSDWLKRVTQLLAKLKHLKWQYTQGTTGRGRSSLGMVNSTGCTSVWASTYPYNPYPFPWTNHLFQDSTSMAMGIFEGHMAKMADGFKAIRMVELELEGKYNPSEHEEFFRYFNWNTFTDEEFELCPPVVAVGGDGALYDIGFQNLSRLMMTGKPIKVVALDTQVYSNTGGQACTSGFTGQVSDMAQYGKAQKGKEEIRKEIGLIGMAHRTTFVLQGTMANTSHLIEGMIRGLKAKRPALFNIYSPCMPEHGIGDELAKHQSKLALESRAYPVFTYDPDKGNVPEECFSLDGNPAMDDDWPSYTLTYVDENGSAGSMELPLTFADFAVTEARFRKHFKKAPRDTWNDDMVPVAEFLKLDADDRDGKFPFVWAVDAKNRLSRVIVSEPVIKSCEDRHNFWVMLKALAGIGKDVDVQAIKDETRRDVVQKLTAGLLELAVGGGSVPMVMPSAPAPAASESGKAPAETSSTAVAPVSGNGASSGNGFVAPFLQSSECTGCGECVLVNPKIFGWNDKKQAVIRDASGGPYKDIVKAAEKCAARAIQPGIPANTSGKEIEKLMKRAAKYNS
jgi:pyruvate-ferredoxin/flavodoxin oxidoreductase